MNQKIKTSFLMPLLMVLPFFDPMCLTYLREAANPSFAVDVVYYCFIGARILVSCFAIIACAKIVKVDDDLWFMGFIAVMMILATLGNSQIFTIAQCFTYIGLLATLRYLYVRDFESTLIACTVLFAIYALGNFYSVYILHGIIKNGGLASTIYFFGGKNSIFMHAIPLLVSLCAISIEKHGKVSRVSILLCFAYAFTALIINSLSSFVCFLVLGMCLIAISFSCSVLKILRAPFLLGLLVLGFCLIVVVQQTDLISVVSEALGRTESRSGSLSGRTEIWNQALMHIAASPLVGNPEGIIYMMSNGVAANHAHSFFLNLVVQYGITPLMFFMIDVVSMSMRANRLWRCLSVGIMTVFCFALLAHSLFDVMDLYVYILVRSLLLHFVSENTRIGVHALFLPVAARRQETE